jgi:hypothetical protein
MQIFQKRVILLSINDGSDTLTRPCVYYIRTVAGKQRQVMIDNSRRIPAAVLSLVTVYLSCLKSLVTRRFLIVGLSFDFISEHSIES